MAVISDRRQIGWPFWQRFLAVACVILMIPLIVAALVVLGLIPVYLTSHAVRQTRNSIVSPLTVTYFVIDQGTGSSTNLKLDTIDRGQMARSLERGLGLRSSNVLQIENISSNIARANGSKRRRKRFVRCDRDPSGRSGPVLIFDFNLTYPLSHTCQSVSCAERMFGEVKQRFQSVSSLRVDFTNTFRELRLCSIGVFFYSDLPTTGNTASTEIGTSRTLAASTASSSVETTRTDTPSSSTITTADVSLPLNETAGPTDTSRCLMKIPFEQEPVAPYRITHTSTIYDQDTQALVVVGASKSESTLVLGTVRQRIIINGVPVTQQCQRTIDVSVPPVCLSSI